MLVCSIFVIIFVVLHNIHAAQHQTCSSNSEPQCSRRAVESIKHINIIFFGATGNLARKYLWKSFFEVYKELVHEKEEYKFSIYAVSRDDKNEGRKFISDFLLNLEKCTNEDCHKLKKGFAGTVQYIKVTSVKNFQELESKLDENTQSLYGMTGSARSNEVGRLFYLAIPPSAYARTAKRIHEYLMPKIGRPWVRVVVEKPFGNDLESARQLNEGLLKNFEESQIYRIDHYLGKEVMKEILPFRIVNAEKYNYLWNSANIEKVEIVLKEKDDVVGRTAFYDENGIIRDVMQNHMTEMLALSAMQLPLLGGSNITEIQQLKLDLLTLLRPSKNENKRLLLGQYSTYNAERLGEDHGNNKTSDTATFAACPIYVDKESLEGLPFIMVSGKKLDEKASYVRVLFKNTQFCMNHKLKYCNEQKQIVFYIGGRLGEFIAVSRGLPAPEFRPDWIELKNSSSLTDIFGQRPEDMLVFVPKQVVQPYTFLIKGIIKGSRHLFVHSYFLYESWKFWSPLIEMSHHVKPRRYLGGHKDPESLEFVVSRPQACVKNHDDGVHFVYDVDNVA